MSLTRVGAEEPKYKYILEFPNRFRVYTSDEQFLFSTLEKCGTFGLPSARQDNAPAKKIKKKEVPIKSLKGHQCPECRSTRLAQDNKGGEIVCMDCGLAIDTEKLIRILEVPHPGKRAHAQASLLADY